MQNDRDGNVSQQEKVKENMRERDKDLAKIGQFGNQFLKFI